jgi:hypothetical protein
MMYKYKYLILKEELKLKNILISEKPLNIYIFILIELDIIKYKKKH